MVNVGTVNKPYMDPMGYAHCSLLRMVLGCGFNGCRNTSLQVIWNTRGCVYNPGFVFLVDFLRIGIPWDSSPSNHYLGEYFGTFSKHSHRKFKYIENDVCVFFSVHMIHYDLYMIERHITISPNGKIYQINLGGNVFAVGARNASSSGWHDWSWSVTVVTEIRFLLVFFQGSLNNPILEGSNLMQMYDHFEGFPYNSALFGLVICVPQTVGMQFFSQVTSGCVFFA